ncbi:N protein [Santa barbara virus]|uniref:Nucleoprotein n=1 Tax=Santa barbara virus TaxID=1552661 RepID=A0A097A599_9RHAB|nr:N protein [Santa barbara virus]AIS40844.1 N protein [Santa barbara virus]
MYCNITEEVITPCIPKEQSDPQYPSDFFGKKQKPQLIIPQSNWEDKALRNAVYYGILGGDLDIRLALQYLYRTLKKLEGELSDDWESFGLKIGRKGEKINPFSMYDVTETQEPNIDGKTGKEVSEEEDQWMPFWILSHYRLAKTQNDAHRVTLAERLNEQILSINPDASEVTSGKSLFLGWALNANYSKIVAGLDMFLNKFKQHSHSFLKMTTLPSRYRDCSAILNLSHISSVTGLDITAVLDWVFVGQVAKEINQMLKPGQEIDKNDSYTPYLMDMGLSMKSPYSATACPTFHTWCNIICCLLHSERSKNARLISENNIMNVTANAMIMVYVISNRVSIVKAYSKEKPPVKMNPTPAPAAKITINNSNADSSDESDDESISSEFLARPRTNDPADWFQYLINNDCNVPEEIKRYIRSEARKITNPRQGTIGKHVLEKMA